MDELLLGGVLYRVTYSSSGPYVSTDGKRVMEGFRFLGVEPA